MTTTPAVERPPRSLRAASYLGILFGLFGAMAGIIAASTFPYLQSQSDYRASATAALTVIAAAGATISVLGIVSGWGLLRSKGWAWNWATFTALASVASVAALTAFWPTRWSFLVVVAGAYGMLLALLAWGAPVAPDTSERSGCQLNDEPYSSSRAAAPRWLRTVGRTVRARLAVVAGRPETDRRASSFPA